MSAVVLLALLFLSPTSWANADCSLTPTRKSEIMAVLKKAATNTPYGNSWWPCKLSFMPEGENIQQHCLDFAPETTAGMLSNKDGELILFRGIGGPYVKGFTEHKKTQNFIKSEGNSYSYSLAPNIAHEWGAYGGGDPYSLIAVQNITTDKLRYPVDISPEVLKKYMALNQPIPDEIHRRPFTRNTKVTDIIYYEEVKVPVEKENVMVILPLEEMRKIVDSFGNFKDPKGPYKVMDLLEKVLASPLAKDPLCQSRAPRAEESEEEEPEKMSNEDSAE